MKDIYVVIYREGQSSYGPVPECYSLEGYYETEKEAQDYCDKENIGRGHDISKEDWWDGIDEYYYEVHPLEHMSKLIAQREEWRREREEKKKAQAGE